MNNQNNNVPKKFPDKGNFSGGNIQKNQFNKPQNQINNLNNSNPKINNLNNQNLNKPNNLPKQQTQPSKLNQLKNNVLRTGARSVANKVAGPVGGQVVDRLTKAKNNNPLPRIPLLKNPLARLSSSKSQTQEEPTEGEALFNEVKKVILPSLSFGGCGTGCLIGIVIICFIYIIITPLIYMDSLLPNKSKTEASFVEKLGNFLTFRGWCGDEECTEREKTDFYEKVKDEYDEYYKRYGVELNTSLIIATLTYSDPFLTFNELDINGNFLTDEPATELVDFRKSAKKVEELAENQLTTCCYVNGVEAFCDFNNDNYSCPVTENVDELEEGEDIVTEGYKIDVERYREYLEDTFIRKYYYNNRNDDETNSKVLLTIEEIFERVEFYEYATGSENTSGNFSLNNTMVTILDCTGNIVIDEVSLYDYLQGILYLEGYATARSEEFLKVMAVAAKNYLYVVNGVTPDSMETNLRIRSCAMNQIFCSVTEGCYNMNDGEDSNHDTIATGASPDGTYHRPPVTNIEVLEKIKRAIDATTTEFIVKDGRFVATQYRSSCTSIVCDSTTNIMDQKVANEMILNGSTYKEVLNYFYLGNIEQISLYTAGYPLDLNNNNITSAYGWRVHPIRNCCRHHGGTDIAAPADANIYAIADGVVVTNQYHSSYGNYIVIGHGSKNATTGYYQYYSLYAHQIRLSKLVKVGDSVIAGQKIGNVGSTGDSTGNHLHIEIYSRDASGNKIGQDPVETFEGVELTGFTSGAIYNSQSHCTSATGKGACG